MYKLRGKKISEPHVKKIGETKQKYSNKNTSSGAPG